MQVTEEELHQIHDMVYKSYVAGIVDGEGYIGISLSGLAPQPQVIVVQKNQQAFLEELCGRWGGTVYLNKTAGGVHQWGLYKKEDIFKFLRDITPYLRFKRRRAELLSKFCELPNLRSAENASELLLVRDSLVEEFEALKSLEGWGKQKEVQSCQ